MPGPAQGSAPVVPAPATGFPSPEEEKRTGNTDAVQSVFERVCAGDVDGFVDFLSDDFVEHETGPGVEPTKAGTKQLFTMLLASFPDLRFDVEDIVESGDKSLSGHEPPVPTRTTLWVPLPVGRE